MSVLPTDIVFYASARMPEADGVTIGGAVDFSRRIMFSDFGQFGVAGQPVTPDNDTPTIRAVSSSASDTATNVTVTIRDVTGVVQSNTQTLNGTTPVTFSYTAAVDRLLYIAASGATANGPIANPGGTTAVGDILVYDITHLANTCQTGSTNATGVTPALLQLGAGDGSSAQLGTVIRLTSGTGVNQLRYVTASSGYGTDVVAVNRNWSSIPDNTTVYSLFNGAILEASPNQVTAIIRPFAGIASDVAGGSTRTYYEKIFCVNNNTATTLTVASVLKTVDPASGTLEFALCNSLNDTGTVANRQTAPASGITAFSTGSAPQTINVPSPQNLPGGAAPNTSGAQGVWLSMQLTAGLAPTKTFFTMRGTGQTT